MGKDLKELVGLKNLRSLDLRETKVTDAGLKELAELKSLQSLNLAHTHVTNVGVKELAGLKNLQSLNLGQHRRNGCGFDGANRPKELDKRLTLPTR